MKLWEVMGRAGQIDHAERKRLMAACGPHGMATLPRTEDGGYSPSYCPKCWTVFSPSGLVLNPPRGRSSSPDDSGCQA